MRATPFLCAIICFILFPGCVATQPQKQSPASGENVFDVRKFGAVGDGKTISTTAIQKALDECGRSGGGTVLFRPGTYLSQPLTLRTKTRLSLEKGALLKATDERSDFEIEGRANSFNPFIGGNDLEEITRSEERRVGKECRSRWSPY